MKYDTDHTTHIFSSVTLVTVALFHLPLSADSLGTSHDAITVCDGSSASFSWPCDLQYDTVRLMTLTFNGLSTQGRHVATISTDGSVTVSSQYSDRVRVRGTSGVYLDSVGVLDSGMYLTKALFHNGTVLERKFTVNVHVPPLLIDDTLTVNQFNTTERCQRIICGHLIFPGFPPVSFMWNTPKGPQSHDASEQVHTIQGCPLLPGNYTCHLTGPALSCAQQLKTYSATSLSASVQVSAEAVKELATKSAEEERTELILMIVVPIIAVMTPLVILGLWLLRHLLSDTCKSGSKRGVETGDSTGQAGHQLCEKSSDLMTYLTFTGVLGASSSSPARSPQRGSRASPSTSAAPETVPLTSAPDDQDEEEEEEPVIIETVPDGDDGAKAVEDVDPIVPIVLPESFRSVFADDADETRL